MINSFLTDKKRPARPSRKCPPDPAPALPAGGFSGRNRDHRRAVVGRSLSSDTSRIHGDPPLFPASPYNGPVITRRAQPFSPKSPSEYAERALSDRNSILFRANKPQKHVMCFPFTDHLFPGISSQIISAVQTICSSGATPGIPSPS